MATKRGMDAKLLYKVGGVGEAGDFIELTNVRDVTMGNEKGEADASTRGNNGFRARVGTLKDLTIEFEMVWNTDDAGFTALREAYDANALIGIQCLDGTGGQGIQADMEVMSFTRTEPLEDVIKANVTLKVGFSDNPPEWIGA